MARTEAHFLLSEEFLVLYTIRNPNVRAPSSHPLHHAHSVDGWPGHVRRCLTVPPLYHPCRAAAGPVSGPAPRLRLRGIVRDERRGYGTLYCRRYLLLAERTCYEGRGHGAA